MKRYLQGVEGASRSRWALLAVASAFAVGLVAAGCGSDGSDTTEATSSAPEATETIEEFGDRLAAAADASASQDCDAVDEFNEDAGLPLPCSEKFAYAYADLEVTGTKDLGPAGVLDITDGEFPDGATVVAARSDDGRYRLIANFQPSGIGLAVDQTSTEPEDQELRDEAAGTFVEATREQDCDAYFKAALTPTQDKRKECRLQFDPDAEIQPQLEAAPDAKPVSLGGTEGFGLHELEAGDSYRVLLTVRNYGPDDDPGDDPYVVVNYRVR